MSLLITPISKQARIAYRAIHKTFVRTEEGEDNADA